jgi:hypothetical protein
MASLPGRFRVLLDGQRPDATELDEEFHVGDRAAGVIFIGQ